jgi:ribose transport system permease protein
MTAQTDASQPLPRDESADGSPPPGQDRPGRRATPFPVWPVLERYALVVLLGAMLAYFSFGSAGEAFSSAANLRTLVGNQTIVAVAALAVMLPLVAGQFDLSVGAVIGLTQIALAAGLSEHGLPLPIAVAAAIGIGGAVGAINGLFVAYFGVNPFIATLGSGTLVGGLVALYTKNQPIVQGIPDGFRSLGTENALGLPRLTWIVVGVAAAVAWALAMTPWGRNLVAVGSNASAAGLAGIAVRRVLLSSFVASGVLAGIGGVLLVAHTGTGNPQVGAGYTLGALSAAFLGATAIRPGRFNVPGTLVGVAFVAVAVNGLTLQGAADWVEPVFNGAALMLAVAASTALGRQRMRGAS